MSKKALSVEDLESQVALELPDREMMLVTVVITNVLNDLDVEIDVKNNNIAVQVCAVVQALNQILVVSGNDTTQVALLDCDIQQNQGGGGNGGGGQG